MTWVHDIWAKQIFRWSFGGYNIENFLICRLYLNLFTLLRDTTIVPWSD